MNECDQRHNCRIECDARLSSNTKNSHRTAESSRPLIVIRFSSRTIRLPFSICATTLKVPDERVYQEKAYCVFLIRAAADRRKFGTRTAGRPGAAAGAASARCTTRQQYNYLLSAERTITPPAPGPGRRDAGHERAPLLKLPRT
ncbi:hypothetical protein EVAR_11080_1 [Eumeta japonica]|uniref:Uncharacterized protein n=1 Tax=Eumeta variegata TaxID=151549 RepID=A0A4C1U430_EUMVA|nr:hypothetical protein EVAR_11080_1 [Eumeta japonica]